jgi:hypothetical protein
MGDPPFMEPTIYFYHVLYISSEYLHIYLSTYLSIYLIFLTTYLPIYLISLSIYLPIYLSSYRSIDLSIYLSHLSTNLSTYPPIDQKIATLLFYLSQNKVHTPHGL